MSIGKKIYAAAIFLAKLTTAVFMILFCLRLFGVFSPIKITEATELPATLGLPWSSLIILPLDLLTTILFYNTDFGSRKMSRRTIYVMFADALVIIIGSIAVFAAMFSLKMFPVREFFIKGTFFLYAVIAVIYVILMFKSLFTKSSESSK